MTDLLLDQLSKEQAEAMREMYKDNESITSILDSHLAKLAEAEAQAKAKAKFEKDIEKLAEKLPHPLDIHNVYLSWREVEVEDTSVEPEEVVIDGKPEMRYPKSKVQSPNTSHLTLHTSQRNFP